MGECYAIARLHMTSLQKHNALARKWAKKYADNEPQWVQWSTEHRKVAREQMLNLAADALECSTVAFDRFAGSWEKKKKALVLSEWEKKVIALLAAEWPEANDQLAVFVVSLTVETELAYIYV